MEEKLKRGCISSYVLKPGETWDDPKVCYHCKQEKKRSDYHPSAFRAKGYFGTCKECRKNFLRQRPIHLSRLEVLQKQPETIKKILLCYLEDPKMGLNEIAKKVGIKPDSVKTYRDSNVYLKAVRLLATERIASLIPFAFKALKGSLDAESEEVRFKAAIEILKNENIIGPTKVDVNIKENFTPQQVKEIIERAKSLPPMTIDAELVP